MVEITDDYVKHLALLARINLSDEEVAKFKPQLAAILAYVEQLNSLDTANLRATSQVTGLAHVSRADDDTSNALEREQLLDQVPATQAGQIKVPKVL